MDENNISQGIPPPLPESTSVNQFRVSSELKRPMKPWKIVVITLSALIMVALLCITTLFITGKMVNREKAPVADVLDVFLLNMSQKDYESAYELFSPRAKKQVQLSHIKRLTEDDYFPIYKDYSSLAILNLRISRSVNQNQNIPQGKTATVSGEVYYANDITGHFDAILENVDKEWMISYINVTVPPDKLK